MKIKKVSLGYWYQRTSLHLAEIQDFLLGVESPLDLDAVKLKHLRENLHLKSVHSDIDVIERLDVEFEGGITARLYEDGLVLLTKEHGTDQDDIKQLNHFFDNAFLPAIKYLFSLGAPVPKELAGIVTPTPIFLVVDGATKVEAAQLFMKYHDTFAEIENKNVQILKGGNFYLINLLGDFDKEEHLIESLIFFKEFKAQLHHYLNVHRVLWEKIEKIKERGSIRGKEVGPLRTELESYKKTLELVDGRMAQMNLYIPTRATIVSKNEWEGFLTSVLEFQYNNLDHTLSYIQSLWTITLNYLDSAIQIFGEINQASTRNSVQALTIISSIGVISGVLGFLATNKLPQVTQLGFIYFGVLMLGTVLINRLLRMVFTNMRYKIHDVKLAKLTSDRHI